MQATALPAIVIVVGILTANSSQASSESAWP